MPMHGTQSAFLVFGMRNGSHLEYEYDRYKVFLFVERNTQRARAIREVVECYVMVCLISAQCQSYPIGELSEPAVITSGRGLKYFLTLRIWMPCWV